MPFWIYPSIRMAFLTQIVDEVPISARVARDNHFSSDRFPPPRTNCFQSTARMGSLAYLAEDRTLDQLSYGSALSPRTMSVSGKGQNWGLESINQVDQQGHRLLRIGACEEDWHTNETFVFKTSQNTHKTLIPSKTTVCRLEQCTAT